MRRFTLLLLPLHLAISSFGQIDLPVQYMNSITASELSEHVHTLSSPAMEGRYTGSEGLRLAAEYIRRDFKEMGLQDPSEKSGQPYFQTFALQKCYWQDQELVSGEIFLRPMEDYFFVSDPEDLEGEFEVVFSGYGLDDDAYSDYTELNAEGKLVMAFSGEPKAKDGTYLISGGKEPSRQSYYFSKVRVAREKGAAGLVIIARDDKDYRKYTRGIRDYRDRSDISYPGDVREKDDFFTLFFSREAAGEILEVSRRKLDKAMKTAGRPGGTGAGMYRGSLSVNTAKECYPMNTENVLGYVEGTDLKEEAVVVVAHYDHLGRRGDDIYFGADDNASGTAAVMEVAEAFATAERAGVRPRRSVIFLAVSAEELGLHGSRYYSEHPLVPLDRTYACVNIDMIGRVGRKADSGPDYVGGMAYVSEDILEVARTGAELAAPELKFRMAYRERVSGGSDHYYFAREGIPSLFYFTGIHEDYHEPTDTPDKVLYDRMEGITRGIFATVWQLANRDEKWRIQN